ncbi:MAG: spiro-SPASM protein [Spirochaetia bacterium]
MRVNVIINGIKSPTYTNQTLYRGKNSREIIVDRLSSMEPVNKIFLFTDDPEYRHENTQTICRNDWNRSTFLSVAAEAAEGETLLILHDDQPFFDDQLALEMIRNHHRYRADFSYADGYPDGLAGELLSPVIIPSLLTIRDPEDIFFPAWNRPVLRKPLFDLVKEDINAFDIETAIAEEDLRLLRIELRTDTKRNFLLCSGFAGLGAFDGSSSISDSVYRMIHQKPDLLRTIPAYFPIQIAGGCPQECEYCPYPKFGGPVLERKDTMDPAEFDGLIEKIASFAPESVIGISLWGDPGNHPSLDEILDSVTARERLALILETSGVNFPENSLRKIAELPESKVRCIHSLDSTDETTYGRLRGRGYKNAIRTAERLIELLGKRVYIQAVRMKENEAEMESFYKNFTDKSSVIIQKYDHFCGRQPDKRVVDLSPLNRYPCWHIKRDFPILLNGDVRICREDIGGEMLLGNAFTEELEAIWQKGLRIYIDHAEGQYPELCRNCDEYYTFNF